MHYRYKNREWEAIPDPLSYEEIEKLYVRCCNYGRISSVEIHEAGDKLPTDGRPATRFCISVAAMEMGVDWIWVDDLPGLLSLLRELEVLIRLEDRQTDEVKYRDEIRQLRLGGSGK